MRQVYKRIVITVTYSAIDVFYLLLYIIFFSQDEATWMTQPFNCFKSYSATDAVTSGMWMFSKPIIVNQNGRKVRFL